jgi:Domain of unknown function (DUF4383)
MAGQSVFTARAPMQTAALGVAAVFLLVGVLGLVPGVTTSYDAMQLSGSASGAMLLGLFQVSILHNLVHLLFGAAGIALARSIAGARHFLVRGGVIYLALWVYGLVVASEGAANFVPLNTADDWLHFVVGVAMVGAGVALGTRRVAPAH